MTETRKASELLSVPWFTGERRYTRPEDAVAGGETLWAGDLLHSGSAGDVEYIEIPHTAWSDYSGDTVTRSNQRAIVSDHGEHVVTVEYRLNGHSLLVRADADLPLDLFEGIVVLATEHPVWCEEDWSALEHELQEEQWAGWGRPDVIYDAEKLLADVAEECPLVQETEVDPGLVDRLAAELYSLGLLEFVAETATDGYFSGRDDLVGAVVKAHVEEQEKSWEDFARTLGVLPGQVELPLGVC